MTAESTHDRARRHEERAQKSADALRAMLTVLATAGIGAAYTVRGAQWHDHWRGAAALFALALMCVIVSWFLVKSRELRRRDEVLKGGTVPQFPRYRWSWSWDIAGACFLLSGVVFLAVGFQP